MQSHNPRPGGQVPGSRDFIITLAVIAVFVSCAVVLGSDSPPRWLRGAAFFIVAPMTAVLLIGIWGSLIALPIWAMWKGARAADARLPPQGGTLTVSPDEGPMAPATAAKELPTPIRWRSPEWVLSGLGIAGETGLIACLLLGWTSAAKAFAAMFLLGAGGWIVKLNVEHGRKRAP